MIRIMGAFFAAVLVLMLASVPAALAGDVKITEGASSASKSAPASTGAPRTEPATPTQNTPAASAEPGPPPQGEATPYTEVTTPAPATSPEDAKLKAIRERAAKMAPKDKETVEKSLAASAKDVDVEALTNGDATVSERFATEFGLTSEALTTERTQYNVGWGEIMVAHTLLSSAPKGTTIEQLYALHAEGLGWGPIAHGLGLRTGSLVSAVKTESMVARGTVLPDGKPARIASNTRVAANRKAKGTATAGTATKEVK